MLYLLLFVDIRARIKRNVHILWYHSAAVKAFSDATHRHHQHVLANDWVHRQQVNALLDVLRIFYHVLLLHRCVRVDREFRTEHDHSAFHTLMHVDRVRDTAEHHFSALPSKSHPRDAQVLETVGDTGQLPVEDKHNNEIPPDSFEHFCHYPGHVYDSLRFGTHRRSLHVSFLGRVTDTHPQSRNLRMQILGVRDIRVHSTRRTLFYKHDVHILRGRFETQVRDHCTNDQRSCCGQRRTKI